MKANKRIYTNGTLHHKGKTPEANFSFPDLSLTTSEFPDFSRFSR